jgi:AraC family transcriptional regulator of arabinose operon
MKINELTRNYDCVSNDFERYIHFHNVPMDNEIELIQIGYHFPNPNVYMGPSIRNHYLFHFICNGEGDFFLKDRKYEVKKNSCFLIRPQMITYYTNLKNLNWEYYWIGLAGFKMDEIISNIGFEEKNDVAIFIGDNVVPQLKEILDLGIKNKDDSVNLNLMVNGKIRIFLNYLITLRKENNLYFSKYKNANNESLFSGTRLHSDYVNNVIQLIQYSYREDICIEDIANTMCLNRSYLSNLFKKYTGKSIKQYLIYYRISQAIILLKKTNLSISEISYRVGFNDALYFSRLFNNKVHYSPTEYRNKFANQDIEDFKIQI